MSANDPKRTFSTKWLQSNTRRKSAEYPLGYRRMPFSNGNFVPRGTAMKKLATAIAAIALIGTPAFTADMAVKAPPPALEPVFGWTGFYVGAELGGDTVTTWTRTSGKQQPPFNTFVVDASSPRKLD